jgi:hypothetical protein
MPPTLHTNFPGGCLGQIEDHSADRLQARLYREDAADGINTQATWFYFHLTGLAGQPFEVVLTGLRDVWCGRPSHSINERDKPVVSDDGRTWRRLPGATFDREAAALTLPLRPIGDELWVAMLEPYGPVELDALAAVVAAAAGTRVRVLGHTVGGRELAWWTAGAPDAGRVHNAQRVAWVVARQHAWESHTSWCCEGLVRALLADDARLARCRVEVLPMLDPDGVARGGTRLNAHGFDLNRHWDETDPDEAEHRRLRPEICCAKAAISAGRPIDLCLNLHDTQNDVMISAAGMPASPPLTALHERLVAAGFSGPLDQRGLAAGSIEDGLWRELGIPSALIELGTADLPGWDHLPTAADRMAFGAVMAEGLLDLLG